MRVSRRQGMPGIDRARLPLRLLLVGVTISLAAAFSPSFLRPPTLAGWTPGGVRSTHLPPPLSAAATLRRGRASVRRGGQLAVRMQGGEEEGEVFPGGLDWREVRARLVAQEQGVEARVGEEDGWVYNAGDLVEPGSVLLGGSANRFGFGLRQQHFHKCVMLVVYLDDDFAKALILNRPSDKRTPRGWRAFFGGDVRGLSAPLAEQEWACIHRLSSPRAIQVSQKVMGSFYYTSLEAAEELVDAGEAVPEDFWTFSGYAGWGAGQLRMEMEERASWHVASASNNVVAGLMEGSQQASTTEAGISTWTGLVQRVGIQPSPDHLSDRLLRAWARKELMGDDAARQDRALEVLSRTQTRRRQQGTEGGTRVGMLLRAALPSRFILSQQFLHKSLLLVLQDSDEATVACVLNRPTANAVVFQVGASDEEEMGPRGVEDRGGEASNVQEEGPRVRMLGFGGEFAGGDDKVFWLHSDPLLQARFVGRPVGPGCSVWRCSQEEMLAALDGSQPDGIDETLFLAVRGFCLWPKGATALETSLQQSWKGLSLSDGGLQAEIDAGAFDRLSYIPQDAWASILRLGAPADARGGEGAAWPATAAGSSSRGSDDSGIRAWELCDAGLAYRSSDASAQSDSGLEMVLSGEEGDPADLEDLADRALREFDRCFLSLPDRV